MFGMKSKIERRIEALENTVARFVQEENCAKGKHDWETVTSSYTDDDPYLRCKFCYAKPKDKKP